MDDTITSDPPEDAKKSRNRSPNHPSLDLEESVKRAKVLHDKYGRHDVPVAIAHKLWGYKEHSGLANQTVAAVKAYGLIDVHGQGKDRKLKITDRADRIIRDAPDRPLLLKKAAKEPAIHSELLAEYGDKGLPPDDILRTYLLWERPGGRFNDDVVDAFIQRFRSTLRYAGLDIDTENGDGEDVDTSNNGTGPEALETPVRVGSFIQWTSNGQEQFPVPPKVLGIESGFAFVEGSPTGLPMSELSVVDPPSNTTPVAAPPTNPFYKPGVPALHGPRIEFPLPDDNVIQIQLRKPVSKKTFERIKALLELSEDSLVEDDD